MSRWRPPQAKSSAIITPDGYAKLERELDALWRKRRVVNDALAAAAAEGDRSENAEYIYRKKEQAGIDRRIRYLQKRMPDLKIVDSVGNKEQIFFGAIVTLLQDQSSTVHYRIVGADETNTQNGDISVDSPLAKALLKKYKGDEVTLQIADKQVTYEVEDIRYS